MKSKKVKEMKKVELLRTLLAILVAVICAVAVIFLVSKEPVNAMYMFFVAPFTSTRYLASIIDTLNHDVSINKVRDNTLKINKLLKRHR